MNKFGKQLRRASPSFFGKQLYSWWKFAPHLQKLEEIILQMYENDERNHLICALPIRFGKTMYIQTLLPFALLCHNPEERIIIASYSSKFSSESVARVRDLIQAYGKEINDIEVDESWAGKDYFRLKGHMGEVRGVSCGSRMAGATATTILADDLYGEQSEADSPTIRKSVETWWHGTLMARKTPNDVHPPKVILIGTPRHPEDIQLTLEAGNPDLPPDEQWLVHRFPAIIDGQPLWDHFPIERLEKIKIQYETMGKGHLFDTLYLCDPKLNPEGGWPQEYLTGLFYNDAPQNKIGIMAIDPNLGTSSERGDFGCIMYALYDQHTNEIWVEDCYLSRGSYDKLEDAAADFMMKYRPKGCLIETNVAFRVVADNIDRKVRNRGMPNPPIYFKTSVENKEKRIDVTLSPLLAQKKIHLKDIRTNRLGLMQMKSFPCGSNDDYPDCLHLLTQIIAELKNNHSI